MMNAPVCISRQQLSMCQGHLIGRCCSRLREKINNVNWRRTTRHVTGSGRYSTDELHEVHWLFLPNQCDRGAVKNWPSRRPGNQWLRYITQTMVHPEGYNVYSCSRHFPNWTTVVRHSVFGDCKNLLK